MTESPSYPNPSEPASSEEIPQTSDYANNASEDDISSSNEKLNVEDLKQALLDVAESDTN